MPSWTRRRARVNQRDNGGLMVQLRSAAPAPKKLLAAAGALCGIGLATLPAHAFPWSTDMYEGAAVQPLAVPPRVMPDGTLPVNGMPQMDLEQMTVGLKNPLKETPENIAHGKDL